MRFIGYRLPTALPGRYENCIREEKDLEKTFKKEISAEADAALVEHTLKLYAFVPPCALARPSVLAVCLRWSAHCAVCC